MFHRLLRGAKSGQHGFTLLELVIAMAILAILMPLLGALFFQFARIPPGVSADLDLQNQLRQAGRWLNLDGTRAQSFVLDSKPEYGTFGWHDYTVSPPVLYQVRYFFQDGELMREERIDGEVSSVITVATGVADYGDILVRACPTFARFTVNLTAERITDTISQSEELFLRLRPEPWGEITQEPLGYALFAASQGGSTVFRYSEEGTFLGTLSLASANRDSKGITTDGTSFWVLDKDDERVYRYDMSGAFLDSFALTTPSDHLEGLTTDGTSIWVLDKNAGVFRYSLAGGYLGESFGLASENSHAEGITTADGNTLWVVDKHADKVFHYSITGSLLASFSVAPATHPEGITTDGTSLWVVDKDTDTVYRFGLAGESLGSFALQSGNDKAGGFTHTPAGDLWVVDEDNPDKESIHWSGSDNLVVGNVHSNGDVFIGGSDNTVTDALSAQGTIIIQGQRYSFGSLQYKGAVIGSFSVSPATHSEGITTEGTTVWVVDKDTDKVYKFGLIGESLGSFPLEIPGNSTAGGLTRTPSGDLWVVDEESNQVFRYSEEGTFLGTLSLASANRDSKGTTTDGTSFWVLDKDDKRAYRYDMGGAFQDSFALTTPSDHLEGITTDGTSIWIVDKDSGVFRYSISGVYQNDSFTLAAENSHPEGIATDGTSLWVVDKHADKVFRYNPQGVPLRPMPINCASDDFPAPTFSWQGDVNLVNEQQVWEDWPGRTRLKPGVYFATGRISLGQSNASGTVTFIADQIHVSGNEVDLWPFHAGIVAFGTGAGNDVIQVSGQRGLWRGMLYAPQGEVDVAGDDFTLYGSIVAQLIKFTRQGTRILHNAY